MLDQNFVLGGTVQLVLGVSMTPTTVRVVLVEGEGADGRVVDRDVFDITAAASASDHVIAAVLGTRESAEAAGHHLVSTGVTWSDRAQGAALRKALRTSGIEDVMLVSELHAAGALAQAVGHITGGELAALMFVEHDAATLSVVETADGSMVKVRSQTLHTDALAELAEMVTELNTPEPQVLGIFLVGSGADLTSIAPQLKDLMPVPVVSPDEPELALARGAALASANAPRFEASTAGLAYSADPDGATAGTATPIGLADDESDSASGTEEAQHGGKPFLLVGSALTAVFVVGIVALVISLAISIRPTADQRPNESTATPSIVAQPPTALPKALPAQPQPAPAPAPQAAPPLPPPPPAQAAQKVPRETAPPASAPVAARNAPPAPAAPAPAAPLDPPPAPPPVAAPLLPNIVPILQPPYYANPPAAPPWYPVQRQPQTPSWSPNYGGPPASAPWYPQAPQYPVQHWPSGPTGPGYGGGQSGGDEGRGSHDRSEGGRHSPIWLWPGD
jgi:hypothetical protein